MAYFQEINRFLAITKKDSSGSDYEEEQRELYLLTLQSYARDALDELDMVDEVIISLFRSLIGGLFH
jgi:hypothetical protein